jgi:PAS domain S-box-containing protein
LASDKRPNLIWGQSCSITAGQKPQKRQDNALIVEAQGMNARGFPEAIDPEQSFRLLADNAPVMIWRSGPDKLCDWFNRPWLEFTGRTMEQELGKGWTEGIHPADMTGSLSTYVAAFDGREEFCMEYRLRRRDGVYRWILDNGRPYASPDGMFRGYFGSCIDVTDSKRAQDELRATQSELARVTRLITMAEMTATIAHNIRQPLAAIEMNSNAALRWLANTSPDLHEVRMALESIVDEGRRASKVIGRVRAIFKKRETETAWLDINELILEMLALMDGELQNQCILVRTELVEKPPQALVDRLHLQQVILNLIMNAVEAMESVTTRARVLKVTSELQEPDNMLITVQDTGIGIDPKDMDRIFDALFTTKSSGMGMGLSICRTIIEAHGGRLWASAAIPHGSIFRLVLPSVKRLAAE